MSLSFRFILVSVGSLCVYSFAYAVFLFSFSLIEFSIAVVLGRLLLIECFCFPFYRLSYAIFPMPSLDSCKHWLILLGLLLLLRLSSIMSLALSFVAHWFSFLTIDSTWFYCPSSLLSSSVTVSLSLSFDRSIDGYSFTCLRTTNHRCSSLPLMLPIGVR